MMVARRGWLWLLAWALVLAPALGQMHRGVHGPQAALAMAAPTAVAAQAHEGGHDGFAELFSSHGSDADCRLFDQLGHSDALPGVPALALPLAAPLFFLDFFEGEALARWRALFDARGPPSVR